jgi:hypothetical protein
MIQATTISKKDKWSDLIVYSIGACIASPEGKKSDPCIAVAYMSGADKQVAFVTMPLPPKGKLYTESDFLSAIRAAEGAANVTYHNAAGVQKDILFCRPTAGAVLDVIPRNYKSGYFEGEFGEVCECGVRFYIEDELTAVLPKKQGTRFTLNIAPVKNEYAVGSLPYALTNAYNACLLGCAFEREELQFETKDRRKVHFEVKRETPIFLNERALYIKPIFREDADTVDFYETEEFNYIDGEDLYVRKYKILYSNRMNGYNIMRA